jgi:hypothetical protein
LSSTWSWTRTHGSDLRRRFLGRLLLEESADSISSRVRTRKKPLQSDNFRYFSFQAFSICQTVLILWNATHQNYSYILHVSTWEEYTIMISVVTFILYGELAAGYEIRQGIRVWADQTWSLALNFFESSSNQEVRLLLLPSIRRALGRKDPPLCIHI